jgi:hypothetical protein
VNLKSIQARARLRHRVVTVLATLTPLLTPCPGSMAQSATFRFPTPNRALLEPGGGPRFLAPTPGKSWTAGGFGCVRSEGSQMHEGIDILATQRDRRGEPSDVVTASAEGEVAYVSRRPALSNYGNYVVLRHRLDGLEVFTLYAHLATIAANVKSGVRIGAGERVGVMGRSTNTRSPIAKDRAHLHFEVDLLLNERFPVWLKKREPDVRDDHGPWNGRNLAGLDPADILRRQAASGNRFSLLEYLRNRPALCRVLVPDASFPWLRRYAPLVRRNAIAEREGVVAHEMALDYNGVPFEAIPRSRSEIKGPLAVRLLSVDEQVQRDHPCRKLVFKRGQSWTLTAKGRELIDLLTE